MTFSMKRVLSVILAAVMVFGMLPPAAVHADAAGLCEHLSEHQAHCSFTPADPGNACACTETDETGALLHLDGCGYRAPSAGVDCTCVCDTCLQAATPSDAAAPEVTDPPQPQKSQAALDTEALIAPLPGLWEAVAASLDEDDIPDEAAYQAFASAVSSARAAWDALSPEDQAQVNNYATLEQYGAYVISNNAATTSHMGCPYGNGTWNTFPTGGDLSDYDTGTNFFLTSDSALTVPPNSSGQYVICLNGKNLQVNTGGASFGANTTICNCKDTKDATGGILDDSISGEPSFGTNGPTVRLQNITIKTGNKAAFVSAATAFVEFQDVTVLGSVNTDFKGNLHLYGTINIPDGVDSTIKLYDKGITGGKIKITGLKEDTVLFDEATATTVNYLDTSNFGDFEPKLENGKLVLQEKPHVCSYYPDVEWTKVTASGPITGAGYYYLGDDSPTGVYPNGAGVVLCLNGHNIAAHPNTAMSGTICDCKKTAKLNSNVVYDYNKSLSWKNLTLQGITLEGRGGLGDGTSHYFFGESLTLQDVTIGTSGILQHMNGGTITMGGDIQITHPFALRGDVTIVDDGIKAGSQIALNVGYLASDTLFTKADENTLAYITALAPATTIYQTRYANGQITLHKGAQTITKGTGLENGSFSVTREGAQIKFFNNEAKLVACEGDTVSISQENMGQGTALLVRDENGNKVSVKTENGVSSFTMPSGPVTVSLIHSCAIHTGITDWIPISKNEDSFEMQNGGHYYLTRSVSISELYSKADGSIEPVLCLNGNTLTVDKIGGGVFYNCRTASGGIRAKTDEIALSGTREHGFIFNNIAFDGCVSAGMNTDPRFDGCTFNNTVNPEAYALSIKNEDDYGFILTGKTIVTGKGMHLTGGTSDHATSISLAEGSSILLTMEPSVRLQASNQAKYFVHPQKDEGYSYGNDAEGYLVVQEPHKHQSRSKVYIPFSGEIKAEDGDAIGTSYNDVWYYLEGDYTGDLEITTNVRAVWLCLNGYTLNGNVTVNDNAIFQICNCKNTGHINGYIDVTGSLGLDDTTRCANYVVARDGAYIDVRSLLPNPLTDGTEQKMPIILQNSSTYPQTNEHAEWYYDVSSRVEANGWTNKVENVAPITFENTTYTAQVKVKERIYYALAYYDTETDAQGVNLYDKDTGTIAVQDILSGLALYKLTLPTGVTASVDPALVSFVFDQGNAKLMPVVPDEYAELFNPAITLSGITDDKVPVFNPSVENLTKQDDGTYTFAMPTSDVTVATQKAHSHGEGDPLTWFPFTGTFEDGKAYYLTSDWNTATDGPITVNAGTLNDITQNLRLCLNGKQIYGDITVNKDKGIVICDCQNNTGFVHGDIDVYGALKVGGEPYLPDSILAQRVIVREGCTYLDLAGVSANNGKRMPVIMQGTPRTDLTFFHPAVLYYYGYDAFEVMLTSLGWADVAEIDETKTQPLESTPYYAYVKLKEPVTYLSGTIGRTDEGVPTIVYEVKTAAAGNSLALYDLALSSRMYTLTVSPGITVVIPEEMAAYVQNLGSGAWMVPAAFSVTLTGISEDAILSYTGVDDSDVTQAEDTDTPGNVTYTFNMPASDVTVEILHQHPVFTNGQDVLWEEFTGTVEPGKNYYLSADYAQPLNIATGTVSICLNGFTISGSITVAKDAQLNLVDHHGGGVVAGVVDVSGSLNTQAGRYTQYVIARSGSSNYIQATEDDVKVPVLMDGLGVSQNQQDFQENYYKTQLHLQDKGWTGKVTYQSGSTKVVDGTTYYAASAEFTVAQPVIYLPLEGYPYFAAVGETITAEAIAMSLPMYTLTVPENVGVSTDSGPDYIIPDAEPAEKYYVYVIPEYMDEFITWFNSIDEGDNKLTFPFPKFSVVLTAPADYKLAVKTNNVTMKEEPAGTYTFAMPTNDVEIGLTHYCTLHTDYTNWIPVKESMDEAPAGNYYLTANNLSFTAGESGVTLCLNGHTLNNLYLDVQTQNFEVCDCTGTGRIEMQRASMFSTWWPVDIIMNGVTISGGMCVISEGTLTLKDVTMEGAQTGMILNNETVFLSGKVVTSNIAMFQVTGTAVLKDAGLTDGASLNLTVDAPRGGPAVLIDQADADTLSRINSIIDYMDKNYLMAYYDAATKQVMLDQGFNVNYQNVSVTVTRKAPEGTVYSDTGSTTVGFEGDIITIAKPAAGYEPVVTPTVSDLTKKPDGTYTFTMPRNAVTITLEQKNPIYSITIPATLSLEENDQKILTNSLTFSVNTWENMDSYQVTASYSGPSAPVLTHELGSGYGQLPLALEFGDTEIDLDETGGYDVFHTFTSKDNISVNVSAPVKNDAFVGTYTGTMNFSFSCISTQTE